MSKQRIFSCVIAAAAIAAWSAGAAAQQITLKLHHLLGPKSPAQVKMLAPWAARVEKATAGKV